MASNHESKFKIGDKARLNNEGLNSLWQTTFGLSHMKTVVYEITDVGSIVTDDGVRPVLVNDKELNVFMLADYMFDKVE